jgi:hypothetical protein
MSVIFAYWVIKKLQNRIVKDKKISYFFVLTPAEDCCFNLVKRWIWIEFSWKY